MEVEEDMEVATEVVTEVDTVVATEVVTEEDMAAMEVAMEDMDTVEKREKLMLSPKLMLLLKPMPITVMEAMEADMAVMVMVDTEDTAMGANGDQLNPATDMAATEEAMAVMEAMVDMEAMVVMEVMVATDMVDMDIMVKTNRTSNHTDRRTKELET